MLPLTAFAADPPADIPPNPFPNRVQAVELEGGVEWLNAGGPITLKELRGKIVLLDFWTYCCINCMHVLPDLDYLEKKFDKEIVVIGVHSAKFDNEKETGNIRKAILRYEIKHPVVNDANMVIWRKFGVRAWPSLVLIDPEGFYCGYVSGEGNRELLEAVVTKLIDYHRAKKTLDETPVQFALEKFKQPTTPLRFPGKLVADAANDRLYISDSNHNRIVVTTLDGKLIDVIGSGTIGEKDGSYTEAQFDRPQGMALVGNVLYVADTENHLLRAVDLTKKTVKTFAGMGEQGQQRIGSAKLRQAGLNSPWDLLVIDDVLYVAMAGPHQIWSHKLGTDTIQPYAGSGREDIRNGTLSESALAQPSGLATDGKNLFVVDSEGSAIRQITTKPGNDLADPVGDVTTVVGTSNLPGGRSLFEFGDVDAIGGEARLQHPLGVVYHDGGLLVADSYNHKIKHVSLKTKASTTWLGTGKAGDGTVPPQLSEPAGLCIANDKLYIADTNNHRVTVVDLATKSMKILIIDGLEPPPPPKQDETLAAGSPVVVPVQSVASGEGIEFSVVLTIPEEYKFNPEVPVTYRLTTEGEQTLIAGDDLNVRDEAAVAKGIASFRVPLAAKTGKGTYQLSMTYGYCRDGTSGLCKLGVATWQVPIEVRADADGNRISLTTPAAK
jgi:thiol-disulfide isomerase/thioredoxin